MPTITTKVREHAKPEELELMEKYILDKDTKNFYLVCRRIHARLWYEANKERAIEAFKKYHKQNSQRCNERRSRNYYKMKELKQQKEIKI
jgi:hypothetical protein